MKRIISLLLVAFFSAPFVSAQDLHFSQVLQSPLLLNPGATGMMEGWFRGSFQHRNQWMGSGGKFHNTTSAFDINLLKDDRRHTAFIGIGGLITNEGAGDGIYGKTSGSVSLSGAIPMGRRGNHILSLGLQTGFASSSIKSENLIFESQWNGATYDPTILSGEPLVPSFSYSDVSTGLHYTFDGSSTGFAGKSKSKLNIGLAVFHANKPTLRYIIGSTEQLERKFVAHASYLKDLTASKFNFSIDAAHFQQGKQREILYGGMLNYTLIDEGNFSGTRSMIGLGLHMRSVESLIPSVMLQHKGFRFELSYDATVSSLRNAHGAGSLEFSLVYTYFDRGLFSGRTPR